MRRLVLFLPLFLLSCKDNPPTVFVEEPVIIEPAPERPSPISNPRETCLFGVVYYSYWDASENKLQNYYTVSETIPSDSLTTRAEQEELLRLLSQDCGPVGATVTITGKEIIRASNREQARYEKIKIGQDLILNHKY